MNNYAVTAENITVEYTTHKYKSSTFKEFIFNKLFKKEEKEIFKALNNINIKVKKGSSFALLGHNGSGKSTLLKVLAGIIEPNNAVIKTAGRLAAMIELGAGFDGELSGLENIKLSCMIMGLTEEEIKVKTNDIIEFSELQDFIDMPVKNYSSGMQARLGFACTTAVDPDVLLIDEVLSVGDSNFSQKCFNRIRDLRKKGTTVILVSHDAGLVKRFCDEGLILSHGKILFEGPIDEALLKYEEVMHNRSLSEEQKQRLKELSRIEKLRVDELVGGKGDLPNIILKSAQVIQFNSAQATIDAHSSFKFEISIDIEQLHFFKNEISFGFGISKTNDIRICGSNNLEIGKKITLNDAKNNYTVTFEFKNGIPYLSSGFYKLVFGVHDENISRTVFVQPLLEFEIVNKNKKLNVDDDIIDIMTDFSFFIK